MNAIKHFLMPHQGKFSVDFLSGLTVALALIPEAIAFALVANVNPLVGLYAAFFMCFITAVFGGRPGMISGATGSMAVVMVGLVSQYGVGYLFAAVIITGIVQVLIGLFKLGKLIRMMPKSVMVGFVNGLAIVIFISQLHQFKMMTPHGWQWVQGSTLYIMIALVLVAMAVTHFLPKITKAIPAALSAIIVVSLIVWLGHVHTRIVADMVTGHSMTSALPSFAWPSVPLTWHTATIVVPYGIILAIIGLSESLMTLSLIDEQTQTHGKGNRECIAQGAANIISGFFQSMGGCAMIGQSMINISSGGRGRLSGIVAGVFLLLFVVVLWPLIKLIPLAALVGVMFMVVYETFEWATFKFIRKIPFHDALIIVVVTAVTVATNLATAVLVGIALASLQFAWNSAKHIYADSHQEDGEHKSYLLHGPLFFGSATRFKQLFDFANDPNDIVIDFRLSRVADQSAIDAIQFIAERYQAIGKKLHLRHLSPECCLLLGKAANLVEQDHFSDPTYHVATDRLD